MRYFLMLNENDIVVDVLQSSGQYNGDCYIEVTEAEFLNASNLIGKLYNRTTGEFEDAPFRLLALMSTDDIKVGDTNESLSERLAAIETALTNLGA